MISCSAFSKISIIMRSPVWYWDGVLSNWLHFELYDNRTRSNPGRIQNICTIDHPTSKKTVYSTEAVEKNPASYSFRSRWTTNTRRMNYSSWRKNISKSSSEKSTFRITSNDRILKSSPEGSKFSRYSSSFRSVTNSMSLLSVLFLFDFSLYITTSFIFYWDRNQTDGSCQNHFRDEYQGKISTKKKISEKYLIESKKRLQSYVSSFFNIANQCKSRMKNPFQKKS